MKHTYVYDHYYRYQEIVDFLQYFSEKNPDCTRLTKIGTTPKGRDILLIEITDLSAGDFSKKPAYYVEGNLHAGEVCGCMTVLYLIDTLLTNRDDASIASLLKKYTFYLLPRVAVDGSEYYLTTPYTVRSADRFFPYPDVMPGLYPEDLDGDGVIRSMRVKSPYGAWKVSGKDPRLMVRRSPEDSEGTFYNVYTEGLIRDYDGITIKDAPAMYANDFNRNYPIGWEPEWKQHGAGVTPLAHPETRANSDFILSHKNICSCVDMHTSGGQILYTPGFESSKKAEADDIAIYKLLGQMACEESGYPLLNVYDGYMPASAPVTNGGFDDFCHFIVGIPAFTIECWDLDERSGIHNTYPPKDELSEQERAEGEEKWLAWIDKNVPAKDGFLPWTPFLHPQLGEVEIGGISPKFISQNPPAAFIEQELAKHVRFMLREVKALPLLQIDRFEAAKLAEGLYEVKAVIGNTGFLPTYIFKEALKNKNVTGVSALLEGAEAILKGKQEEKLGHLQGYFGVGTMSWSFPAHSVEREPQRKEVSWLIRAAKGSTLTLTAACSRAGQVLSTLTLED